MTGPEPLDLEDGEDFTQPPPPSAQEPDDGPPSTPPGNPPREEPGVLGRVWGWLRERNWPEGKPPERRWLLKRPAAPEEESAHPRGFLPLGKVGMLAAAGGAGKTMALAQLAAAVATGRSWLGHYTIPAESRGPVLLALGEEDEEEVRRRLYDIREGLGLSAEEWGALKQNLMILPLAGVPVQLVSAQDRNGKPEETPFFHELRRRIDGAGVDWRLLVLDPLSRWAGPETETDNFAATRFVAAVESLSQVPGTPTVLLAHHTTKVARRGLDAGEATAARGASALTDGVRWVANLLYPEGSSLPHLSLVKSNYTARAPALPLKREEGGVLRALSSQELEAQLAAERAKSTRKASEKNGKASKKNHQEPEETDDDPNAPF
jgi:RecA-family ATPase